MEKKLVLKCLLQTGIQILVFGLLMFIWNKELLFSNYCVMLIVFTLISFITNFIVIKKTNKN